MNYDLLCNKKNPQNIEKILEKINLFKKKEKKNFSHSSNKISIFFLYLPYKMDVVVIPCSYSICKTKVKQFFFTETSN